jgi:hypothetical protein
VKLFLCNHVSSNVANNVECEDCSPSVARKVREGAVHLKNMGQEYFGLEFQPYPIFDFLRTDGF